MILLNYTLTSYFDFLHQVAELFSAQVKDNLVIVPEQYGTGYFKTVSIMNDLEALVYSIRLNDNLIFKRQKTNNEYYTLVFDEVKNQEGFSIRIGTEETTDEQGRRAAIYLTSFLYDVENMLNKGTEIRGVRILLSAAWMKQYLQLSERENVLEKYIALKTSGIWYKPVDAELKELLNDVLKGDGIPLLFYQNKILRIIEIFFHWLYDEMSLLKDKTGISRTDIESAQKVEGILTNDITVVPPTIKQLAREVAMSESKLKKIFKTVYSLPPYEYFQKKRMQKAKIMLLSGNYSIKDIGYTLGYANLSNFTLAFKKEFGKLPSEVVRERSGPLSPGGEAHPNPPEGRT